ncbi:HAMP domain-containing sensor histidine kinase [soil metagenome]|jgi:signal transduction histidine kinase
MRALLQTVCVALVFLLGALAVTIVVGATLFGVPVSDLPIFTLLLAGAGGGVGVLALALLRPAVLGRLGGVRAQLVGAGLVGSLLLLGMILAGAQAMFISVHDFVVVLTMLLFAVILSVGFSLLYAAPIANRIQRLRRGATQLTEGKLDTEIPVDGHDEISDLARDFNRMASALNESAERERALEQSRRDLIAAVSHDLRTPLASTRALIEAVADGVAADPETEARYLQSARGELAHLSRLVDDLFELARIDAGVMQLSLEQASLRDLVSDTLASFQPQAEKQGVRLIGDIEGEVDPVLANPPKLQRVLHNLVSNALRHTPTDGTVALRATSQEDKVQVEVEDTGEGIATEDLPHVFERSFRSEKSRTRSEEDYTGAGLGLAIARGLIEAHGGEVHAESQPGKGSRFRFTLRRV